jgi:hypothetical protein
MSPAELDARVAAIVARTLREQGLDREPPRRPGRCRGDRLLVALPAEVAERARALYGPMA